MTSTRHTDFQPPGALSDEQLHTLEEMVAALRPDQLIWVRGYLTGITASAKAPGATIPAGEHTGQPDRRGAASLTVLFGSETGNAREVARQVAQASQARGINADVRDLAQVGRTDWKHFETLLLIVSTHGEGEAPEPARAALALLHGQRAPRLDHLRYTVLALGDSSYEHFCQAGRDFDVRLAELGGTTLIPRVECDVDYEEPAAAWIESALEAVASATTRPEFAAPPSARSQPSAMPGTSKRHPVRAPVLENHPLTAEGSSKEVRHIELSLEDVALDYEPGDVLYVLPRNQSAHVEELLKALPADPEQPVQTGATQIPLQLALTERYEITKVTRPFLERYAQWACDPALDEILTAQDKRVPRGFINGRHVVDVIHEFPAGITPQQLIDILRPLPPRAYSIASSNRATPGEVHLTVGVSRYAGRASEHRGVASGWLADLDTEDSEAPLYVRANEHFRLPQDPDTPVIMVGSGTGVAPYRGFLAERRATGARGENWLFFGDRNFETDFLYQREWLDHRDQGLLTRLDVAWSRDGHDKRYVQHSIETRAREVYDWLERGAHLYVCGSTRMAEDVHGALLGVVRQEGAASPERAHDYVEALKRNSRYHRDVYDT
jgi:sulfite reductase (NADPH) flavoprotein alpha-component